jgi:hypothetical protein
VPLAGVGTRLHFYGVPEAVNASKTVDRTLLVLKVSRKLGSYPGARNSLRPLPWANRKRRSDRAGQREGSGEKHCYTYSLRQRLSNDGLGELPICT